MSKPLDFAGVLAQDAALLRLARESALLIHRSDIRAAGNEVEKAVRDYFRRVLPQRYYVTSGHLIDSAHELSPQIDLIIADASNLPSLYTARDGTEYIPITSVYAIGEIKSTYFKSKKYFDQIKKTLAKIQKMDRPLVPNTAFQGELTDDTTFYDIALGSNNRFLNQLFSFLFCVDAGDFSFEDIAAHLRTTHLSLVPNITVLLDKGMITRSQRKEDGSVGYHRYPTEAPPPEYDWMFAESASDGSNLAVLYGMLVDHLNNSHLEPASARPYTSKLLAFRRSSVRWARDTPTRRKQG